jgi:predicted ferric reductase
MIIGLLVWVAYIPFNYQSTSIWYKTGADRVLLRTGKVIGLMAATLLFFQVLFISRLKIIEAILPFKWLMRIHRFNGGILAFLALLHPFFVLTLEDIRNMPAEWRYWPEGIGAILLFLIWIILITGKWRTFWNFSIGTWRVFHKFATLSAVILAATHILNVSDTYVVGPPRFYIVSAVAVFILLWLWLQIKKRSGRFQYEIFVLLSGPDPLFFPFYMHTL